ncbi:hypothetical protein QFC22_002578 [Naganishia vaughanmartiniae]|uniref:Uncharacterized protein n=1 Tax=Naganishia vaughanmartiniae TaxID=1424756 RepID=A0ACC2XAI7_9TREE|nr:hypothetical protein QFC22_002578 [Naganishia vaughanmartiniae]
MSLTSIEQTIYKKLKAQASQANPELRSALQGTPKEEIANGINGLSRKGLILIKKSGTRLLYQAVSKEEAKRTGTFEHDEGLVYGYIKDAGNMGAWARTLKTATNLPQTSFLKAIKGLEQKMAIKLVKSVKFPTRRIYMLSNLTPSVELTGGPWYSDGGLDQSFIDGLLGACLMHVKKQTFPRKQPKHELISDVAYVSNPVHGPSHTKRLPSPNDILDFITASKVATTTLAVEHVIQLMNVLVYNGEVEILKPLSGTRHDEGWNSDLEGDGGGMGLKEWKDEVDTRKNKQKREKDKDKSKSGPRKRARSGSESDDTDKKGKSKSRSKSRATTTTASDSDADMTASASDKDSSSESDNDSSGDEKARAKKRQRKEKEKELKKKKRAREKEKEKRRRRKEKERKAKEKKKERERRKKKEEKEKKRREREKSEKKRSKSRTAGSDSDSDVLMEIGDRKKKRSSSKKRRGSSSDSDSSSISSSDSSSMSESSFVSSSASSSSGLSDSDSDSGKKKLKSKANGKKPETTIDFAADNVAQHSMFDFEHDIYNDADVVYRAVHPPPADAVWRVSDAPCVECPVHTFCSETGPVNPSGCVYYNEWLGWDYV